MSHCHSGLCPFIDAGDVVSHSAGWCHGAMLCRVTLRCMMPILMLGLWGCAVLCHTHHTAPVRRW